MADIPVSVVPNVWLVTCKGCGSYDIAGPGHPAVRQNADTGLHELFDRTAIRHAHPDSCLPDANGSRPMDFSFMAAPAAMNAAQVSS